MNERATAVLDPFRHFEENAKPEVRAWLKERADETEQHLEKCVWRNKLRARFEVLFGADEFGIPEP